MNALPIAMILFLSGSPAPSADFTLLPSGTRAEAIREELRPYLDRAALDHLTARKAALEPLIASGDFTARQEALRAQFIARIGGLPERTPLNPQVTGKGAGDGYRYEKILFESRPNFHVSAVLYMPATPPPYPAVLVPCGHAKEAKAFDPYQRICILLAKNGVAAFCFDPPGQGERLYFVGKDGESLLDATLQHTVAGADCILTGMNISQFFIWDGMRALDYLQSRTDIDGTRLGCTGQSGGGTQTAYLMALDPRIACAAPTCYITSFERLLATIGPQDAEQNTFSMIADNMDHGDYLFMRAPKPTLVCAATRDFFDIAGTHDTVAEERRVYAALKAPERLDIFETDDQHALNRAMRQAIVRWMRRWLMNQDAPITEADFPIATEQDLHCAPDGLVVHLPGERTILDFVAGREKMLAEKRAAFWRDTPRAQALDKVREHIGAHRMNALPEPKTETLDTTDRETGALARLLIEVEPGIKLPAVLVTPKGTIKEGVILCPDGRNTGSSMPNADIDSFARNGKAALIVDLRGVGELESKENQPEWRDKCGPEYVNFLRAYLLGRSLVAMRSDDILSCARFLRGRLPENAPMRLYGYSSTAIPALHASAFEPGLFASVILLDAPPSWSEVVRTPHARGQLINAVQGALECYDLPNLIGDRSVTRVDLGKTLLPQF